MLRRALLAASRSDRLERLITAAPPTRGVVRRYVAGERIADAVRVVGELRREGLLVSVDRLGEDVTRAAEATAVADAYLDLLAALTEHGLAAGTDLSVKPSALGLRVSARLARDNIARICAAAERAGATVTIDMEEPAAVEATYALHADLRKDHPATGVVVQSYLLKAEEYCRALADCRVRLCKGAYRPPPGVAYRSAREVDRSFARCLRVLMAGPGYPMIATHDPRLLEIAAALAVLHGRRPDRFEIQMLYGVRPAEQRRLVRQGTPTRVYVPYGRDWYGYLMRRLAERPANLAFFARSLITRS